MLPLRAATPLSLQIRLWLRKTNTEAEEHATRLHGDAGTKSGLRVVAGDKRPGFLHEHSSRKYGEGREGGAPGRKPEAETETAAGSAPHPSKLTAKWKEEKE